jgi:carbon monoxide dehydrogenase subunit G
VRLEHSLVVRRPRPAVFAFLADPAKLVLWQSGILDVQTSGDAVDVGYRHREIRSLLGMRIEQTLEVIAYDPPERLELEVVEGPFPLRISHVLSETGDGETQIHVVGEGEPGPLFRFGARLVTRKVRDQSRRDFGRLKELLEEDPG